MMSCCVFFFNDTATPEIYTYGHTISLHDALPIWKIIDGLEDDYDKGRLMGAFVEDCAGTDGFSCKAQGAFSIASTTRAQQAIKDGSFKDEIVPLTETVGKEQVLISNDEQPQKAELGKIALLKPAQIGRAHV